MKTKDIEKLLFKAFNEGKRQALEEVMKDVDKLKFRSHEIGDTGEEYVLSKIENLIKAKLKEVE